ncbi:hypothetical protein AVEN_262235-1 [Araneus ventricosus]|uniref:Uncharacterized protein n=1 Tax=Araneus ventricosus TaxID=182803 RepID=A0A4Y2GFQ1_ARAVE|nr:hypothetical protein AVEN_262235-1 [Araneus ventricosus]
MSLFLAIDSVIARQFTPNQFLFTANNFRGCHPVDFRLPNKLSPTDLPGLLTAQLRATANWSDTPLSNVPPFSSFISNASPPPSATKLSFRAGVCMTVSHLFRTADSGQTHSGGTKFNINQTPLQNRQRNIQEGYNPPRFDIARHDRVLVCTRLSV